MARMLTRLAVLAVVLAPLGARAVPLLQLDILGGRYDATTQTIVTQADHFTLFAYAAPTAAVPQSSVLATQFRLSIALDPGVGPAPADLGSLRIDGREIRATADMVYGFAPLELTGVGHFDPGDLARHGVFATFFTEVEFAFAASQTSRLFDSALRTGLGPIAGTGMLTHAFDLDTSRLAPGIELHFDLYSTLTRRGDVDVDWFAPFSHDAATVAGGAPVPEPSAALVFGGALALLCCEARRPAPLRAG